MKFTHLLSDRMYRNSFYLIASSGVLMGTGFLFWMLVARFYTSEEVGIATTTYSLLTTISGFSLIGITSGLARFLPSGDFAQQKINTSLTLITMVTLVLALGVVFFMPFISPSLSFIHDNMLLSGMFILFCVLLSANSIAESSLISFGRAKSILHKNTILGVMKLILPVFLFTLGGFGIVMAMVGGVFASLVYSVYIFSKQHNLRFRPLIHLPSLHLMGSYSLGSYIGSMTANLHIYVLPILITNVMSASTTAYYNIGATIAGVIFMIPQMVSQNLLVEGSADMQNTFLYAKKAVKIIFAFIVPAIICVWIFGGLFLDIFGREYSREGLAFLRAYSLSGIFVGLNYVFGTILYIQKRIRTVIIVSLVSSLTVILFSVLFQHMGLVGVGLATFVAQLVLSILYAFLLGFGKAAKHVTAPVYRVNTKAHGQ